MTFPSTLENNKKRHVNDASLPEHGQPDVQTNPVTSPKAAIYPSVTPSYHASPHLAEVPAPASPPVSLPSSTVRALALLPPCIRDRKLRAFSFASKLSPVQNATLSAWLLDDKMSIEDIRRKVAAPPPEGFGMETHRNTLRRLRKTLENMNVNTAVSDAMDTAYDILTEEDTSQTAPLLEALSVMLCSRAVLAAKQPVQPGIIDKLVTTLAKVQKLKTHHSLEARPRSADTRHRVELSIVPANPARQTAPKIVEITATHASCRDSTS
jgi:hypothetical protein